MENFPIIISLAGCTFTIVASMIAMMLWVRSEGNADRRDIVNLIVSIKEDTANFRKEMADEMKDFHGRLCTIEERRKER